MIDYKSNTEVTLAVSELLQVVIDEKSPKDELCLNLSVKEVSLLAAGLLALDVGLGGALVSEKLKSHPEFNKILDMNSKIQEVMEKTKNKISLAVWDQKIPASMKRPTPPLQ